MLHRGLLPPCPETIIRQAKISSFLTLLTGDAMQWVTAVWESVSPFCRDFDHAAVGKEVGERLLTVRQGKCRMAACALEFRVVAAESGWNGPPLKAVFRKGLNDVCIPKWFVEMTNISTERKHSCSRTDATWKLVL